MKFFYLFFPLKIKSQVIHSDMKWFSPNSVKLAGFSSLSFYLIYVICMSNHCSKQLDYERPKLVTRPWILDRQLNYFPFKNENHFYVRKERERETTTQQQRCGKKRNPQKSQGTPIKKVTCSTKKIPIIIWYDILRQDQLDEYWLAPI